MEQLECLDASEVIRSLELDLTPFHGHLIVPTEGVQSVQTAHPQAAYPAQFRQQMVELVQAGRSASDLSREFGPHVTSILSWEPNPRTKRGQRWIDAQTAATGEALAGIGGVEGANFEMEFLYDV